jgi:hypothetical protein
MRHRPKKEPETDRPILNRRATSRLSKYGFEKGAALTMPLQNRAFFRSLKNPGNFISSAGSPLVAMPWHKKSHQPLQSGTVSRNRSALGALGCGGSQLGHGLLDQSPQGLNFESTGTQVSGDGQSGLGGALL